MASEGHGTGDSMDMSEHLRTWKQFTGFIKWSIGGILCVMAMLLIFRTHN